MRNSPTEEPTESPALPAPHAAPSASPAATRPARATPPAKKGSGRTVLIVVLVVMGLAAVAWWTHSKTRHAPGVMGGGRRGSYGMNGPQPVVAQPAVQGDLHEYLNGLGTVTPLATVTVRTQINGLLMQINFTEGQMVKQGDLLAVVDPRPYQVALEQAQGQLVQAQAQLKEAQVDLARYETLSQQDSIAKQQVDTQQALVSQYTGLVQTDQAAIDSAKLNLAYCHVTAPVTGRVGLRQVDQGNYVTPGDTNGLVVLTEVKPITVIFTLPEDNVPAVAAQLHAGAKLVVDAFDRTQSRKLASGILSTIDNEIDTTTGTFKLRALFANDDETLFPNQFVNIRLLLDTRHGALVIPTSSIERGQQGTFVYVVGPDQTVSARNVVLNVTEGELVGVSSGLAAGESVVVDGADKLKEGMKVIAQKPGDQNPSAGVPAKSTAPGAAGRHRRGNRGGFGSSQSNGTPAGAPAKPAPAQGNSN